MGSFGDVAAFSFCQDKIMTTGGEGGMLVTNDEALWRRAWAFKDHGKSYDAVYHQSHPPGFKWLHESIGTNWRMTEMQGRDRPPPAGSTAGVAARPPTQQRPRLSPGGCAGLRCCGCPSRRRTSATRATSSTHSSDRSGSPRAGRATGSWPRSTMAGFPASPGRAPRSIGSRRSPAWPRRKALPVARELGETSLMFLVHPTLTSDDLTMTCRVVEAICAQASRETAGAGTMAPV